MEKSEDPYQIIVFLNDGDGLSWKRQIVKNYGIHSGKIADVGNDGDMDIIANRNFDRAPLELWENLIINQSSGQGKEKPQCNRKSVTFRHMEKISCRELSSK